MQVRIIIKGGKWVTFLGKLENISKVVGKDLLIAAGSPVTASILSVVYPPAGAILGKLQGAIQAAEIAFANTPGKQGPAKAATVVADFNASLSVAQAALNVTGKQLTYDGDKLQAAIDAIVAAYNAIHDLEQTIKVIDLPKQ